MRNEIAQVLEHIRRGAGTLATRNTDNTQVMQQIKALNERISALTVLLTVHLRLDHGFVLSPENERTLDEQSSCTKM